MTSPEWQTQTGAPSAFYRCPIRGQMPIELHNVTMQQRSIFMAGNSATVGLAALGVSAMTMYGRARQQRLEGQVHFVEARGEATLMSDRMILHLVATGEVRGVRIKRDPAAQTMDYEIPYRLLQRWGTEPHGVYLDVFGQGVIWVQPQDNGEFAQWLAHLSHDKTWRPPTPLQLSAHVPVVGWCQHDPRFVFGLPAGWYDPDPELVAPFARQLAPSALRAAVLTQDGDWEAQVFVIEIGGEDASLPTDPEFMAADMAAGSVITPIGPIQSAELDGEFTVLSRGTSSTPGGTTDRTYVHVTRNGVHFMLWYGIVGGIVGDGSHERWLPDLHTMLSTWHWYA